MRKSDLNILIIEDDVSLAKAIAEALKRSDYKVLRANNPEESQSMMKLHEIHAVIVDCMLPKMNGVDLACRLREISGDEFKIIFISGIFKDRTFSKDALNKTKGHAFLTKPFELEELIATIDEAFKDVIEEDRPLLLDFLSQESFSGKDRRRAIKESTTVQGQDLPLLYSLLIGSELSGDLTLKDEKGDESIISWADGEIVQVAIQDKTSYFGVLLVERGFTSNEELEESLSSDSKKPIGQRLVDASAMSPHAVQLVHKDQMAIRLSKTVQDGPVEVKFVERVKETLAARIDQVAFIHLLNDWMTSKFTKDWYYSFYMTWMSAPIRLTQNQSLIKTIRKNTDIPHLDFVLSRLDSHLTLAELLESNEHDDEEVLQVIHLLALTKAVIFERANKGLSNFDSQLKRLRKIKEEMAARNCFEILGLSSRASSNRINQAYLELAKSLHPDKVEPSAPPEIHTLTKDVFALINDAYNEIRDPEKRRAYLQTLEKGRAEEALQGEALFDEGRQLLTQRRYQEALDIFKKVAKIKNHRSDLYIYLAWAKIKRGTSKNKLQLLIDSVSKDLRQVPPEDRHSTEYFFVKGIYYRTAGVLDKAEQNLKHARAIDPSFIEVKRELIYLKETHLRRKQNMSFTSELTQLTKAVGRIFNAGSTKKRK